MIDYRIYIKESMESDIMYHATFGCYLGDITKNGLMIDSNHNWADSKNCIYLSDDLDVAASYCEAAEVADEIYDSGIYVIHIDISKLDSSKLTSDENVLDDDSTFEYHDNIPPNCFITIEEYE